MSSEASAHLYDIVDPDPQSVSLDSWQKILDSMKKSHWFGQLGHRFGFVSTTSYKNMIAGFFAHEGQKQGVEYDEKKTPSEFRINSFEHLFFVIFTDTSQLLLQHRNIYGFDNLGLPDMRNDLLKALATILRENGIGVVGEGIKVEPANTVYSQEELLEFFLQNRVFRLQVDNLQQSRKPEPNQKNWALYNPNFDKNEAAWGVVSDSIKAGLENATVEGKDGIDVKGLSKSPIPKALAIIGDIQLVEARNHNEVKLIRTREVKSDFTISIPESHSASIGKIEQAMDSLIVKPGLGEEERKAAHEKRRIKREKEGFLGTLFDKSSE